MAVIELLYEADATPEITREVVVKSLQRLLDQLHWPVWMLKEHFYSTENGQTVHIEGLDFNPDQVEFRVDADEEVVSGRYALAVSVQREGEEFTLEDRWKALGKPVNRHVPEPAYFCAWAGFLPLLYHSNDVSGAFEQPEVSYVLIRYDCIEARGQESKGFGHKAPQPLKSSCLMESWDALRDRDAVMFGEYPPSMMQEPLRLA